MCGKSYHISASHIAVTVHITARHKMDSTDNYAIMFRYQRIIVRHISASDKVWSISNSIVVGVASSVITPMIARAVCVVCVRVCWIVISNGIGCVPVIGVLTVVPCLWRYASVVVDKDIPADVVL